MPMYDMGCPSCDLKRIDVIAKMDEKPPCPACGTPMEHLWTATPVMINDSCDMIVENLASHPLYFDSKTKWRERMKLEGKINKVKHTPVPGSDKSPVTTRWV